MVKGWTVVVCDGGRERRGERAELFERRRRPGGGFRAGPQVPLGDLLSTFTARVALLLAGGGEGKRPVGCRLFLDACRREDGGWSAGPWDGESDPEYTFYGLCLEALEREGGG